MANQHCRGRHEKGAARWGRAAEAIKSGGAERIYMQSARVQQCCGQAVARRAVRRLAPPPPLLFFLRGFLRAASSSES